MNEIHEQLVNWDQSLVDGIEIIEKNKVSVQSIQEIDEVLSAKNLDQYNVTHVGICQDIITEQKKLIKNLQTKKNKVEDQLVQMGQKDKIISNYISLQNGSVFVGKDY